MKSDTEVVEVVETIETRAQALGKDSVRNRSAPGYRHGHSAQERLSGQVLRCAQPSRGRLHPLIDVELIPLGEGQQPTKHEFLLLSKSHVRLAHPAAERD